MLEINLLIPFTDHSRAAGCRSASQPPTTLQHRLCWTWRDMAAALLAAPLFAGSAVGCVATVSHIHHALKFGYCLTSSEMAKMTANTVASTIAGTMAGEMLLRFRAARLYM